LQQDILQRLGWDTSRYQQLAIHDPGQCLGEWQVAQAGIDLYTRYKSGRSGLCLHRLNGNRPCGVLDTSHGIGTWLPSINPTSVDRGDPALTAFSGCCRSLAVIPSLLYSSPQFSHTCAGADLTISIVASGASETVAIPGRASPCLQMTHFRMSSFYGSSVPTGREQARRLV
jgi:hypothetical protein